MPATCNNCQKPLSADGSCAACMLRLALRYKDENPLLPDQRKPVTPATSQPTEAHNDLPSIDELNARLTNFEVHRLIGRGGMGGIYQARQRNLDRDVAIKLISPQVSKDPAFIERFDREAKALAKLSHPGIVGIFDCGQTSDGLAYLVMEFVDGVNLRQAMQLHQIIASEAVELTIRICDALEYAHSKGVVHRDIKPENILIGEDGTLKVADFGIAKLTDPDVRTPTLTATRQVLGSLHYLAPEHIESPSSIDHRVDIYAVGVVLYELLTGHLPIGRYEPPSSVVSALGSAIDEVVQRALSRRPQDRYQSADELRTALRAVQSSETMDANVALPVLEPLQRVAIPFTSEAMNGFAETLGVIYVDPDGLTVEFRTRDVFFHSSFSGKTKIVQIPRSRLVKLRLTPGMFHATLTVIADSISSLGDLPNAEAGQVKLKIKSSDLSEAQHALKLLGYKERSDSSVFHVDAADNPFSAWQRTTYGVLTLLSSILNLGCLAIAIVLLTQEFKGGELAVSIIAVSITLGAISGLQAFVGAVHLAGFSRGLANANNTISLIPITPVWMLSGPLALWAWACMNADNSTDAEGKANTLVDKLQPRKRQASASIGSTTLMLLRESRWGRMIGLLNAFGSVLIICGIVIFANGLYNVDLKYRVLSPVASSDSAMDPPSSHVLASIPRSTTVSDSVPGDDVQLVVAGSGPEAELPSSLSKQIASVRRRLEGLNATVTQDGDSAIKIRCLRRSTQAVNDALAIDGPLEIGWIGSSSDDQAKASALPTLIQPRRRDPSQVGVGSNEATKKGLVQTLSVQRVEELQSQYVMEIKQWDMPSVGKTAEKTSSESAAATDVSTQNIVPQATRQIVVKLTATGRAWLAGQESQSSSVTSSEPSGGHVALIVDGMIVGLADVSAIRPDRITFYLAPEYDASIAALRSALRGPALDVDLEPLD